MAINPLLVSIKQASDLTTAIPTTDGFFFYYEDGDLRKAEMTEIYDRVTSGIKGVATQAGAPTPYTTGYLFERWSVTSPITAPNDWDDLTVTQAELDDNDVFFDFTNGVGVKYLSEKIKGDSAYQVALANGYVGSEASWLASLNTVIDSFISTKNLFNKNDLVTDWFPNYYGEVTSNVGFNYKTAKAFLTAVGGSPTTYVINQKMSPNNSYRLERASDNSEISAGQLTSATTYLTITVSEDAWFYILIDTVDNSIPDINTYQIEEGTVPTEYEPFGYIKSINGLTFQEPEQQIPSRYANKRFLTAGDSITEGTMGGYVQYIEQALGTTVTNVGSSGAKTGRLLGILTDIKDRTDIAVGATPDYTLYEGGTIMIGTNVDTVIGSMADIPPTDNVLNHATTELDYFDSFPNSFYGNMGIIIEFIKWKNPKFVINLVSPPPQAGTNNPELVSDRLREIAEFYGVNFIDATHEAGMPAKLANLYTYDGTHFNELGNEIWGKFIAERLKS